MSWNVRRYAELDPDGDPIVSTCGHSHRCENTALRCAVNWVRGQCVTKRNGLAVAPRVLSYRVQREGSLYDIATAERNPV